jgi:alkylation response protein AidB-like acyl-CoA dehydrogenase
MFSPPVKDMMFTLNDIVEMGDLVRFEQFADAGSDVVEAILDECAKLMRDEVAPMNAVGDQVEAQFNDGAVTYPPGAIEAWKKVQELGLVGLASEIEYGGGGMPQSVFAPVQEMLCGANLAFAQLPSLTIGAAEAIAAHGSDDLKEKYLSKLITGEWGGTMNLTEPQAGSDVGALITKAISAGDGTYRIQGQKIYITCGEHDLTDNIVHLVLARLEGAPAGTRGISLFLVPKYPVADDGTFGDRNDLRCVSIEHKMGLKGSCACTMAYGDNGECVGYLIGEENKGLMAMFTMMNTVRLHVGLQGVGCAERGYQQALRYAAERVQGSPVGGDGSKATIINHADVRRMLMTMKARIEAARAINYMNGKAIDMAHALEGSDAGKYWRTMTDILTPLSKAYGTDMGVAVVDDAVQVHGGMGFIEETGIAQIYRDVRITPIYEGTNGIQSWDLANRKLKMDGGDGIKGLLTEIKEFAETKLTDNLEGMKAALLAAVDAVFEVTDWFLAMHGENARAVAAGSVPYQRMMSETVGAWLLAKGAIAAQNRMRNGDSDTDYLTSKIIVAKFYAERLLPLSTALAQTIKTGDELLFALDERQLGLA